MNHKDNSIVAVGSGGNNFLAARFLFDGSILLGGYDYTAGTNGNIALADLLDENTVSVL